MPPAQADVSGPLGAVAANPVGLRAWRRAWGRQGYSLLLGLVNAAPEVGDLQTTQGTHLRVRTGPGRPRRSHRVLAPLVWRSSDSCL